MLINLYLMFVILTASVWLCADVCLLRPSWDAIVLDQLKAPLFLPYSCSYSTDVCCPESMLVVYVQMHVC